MCLVNPESKQLLHILVVLDPKRAVQQDGTLLAAVTPIARALGAAVALLRLWRRCGSLGVSHTFARAHCALAAILARTWESPLRAFRGASTFATTEGGGAAFAGWCALVRVHRHSLAAMQSNTGGYGYRCVLFGWIGRAFWTADTGVIMSAD